MKTLTKSELVIKLENLRNTKQIRKGSLQYKMIESVINGEKLVRPIWSTGGNWSSSSLIDKTLEYTEGLSKMGISFERGNDSPRGGKTGCFIKITSNIL